MFTVSVRCLKLLFNALTARISKSGALEIVKNILHPGREHEPCAFVLFDNACKLKPCCIMRSLQTSKPFSRKLDPPWLFDQRSKFYIWSCERFWKLQFYCDWPEKRLRSCWRKGWKSCRWFRGKSSPTSLESQPLPYLR